MTKITITCPAKVNLFLAILEKDTYGLHKIETIMARTNFFEDFLHIKKADKFEFKCSEFPGEGNSVVQAVRLLEKETNKKFNYKIHLEKNIPAQSGLGGANSNAASIMLYLNESEHLNLSKAALSKLANKIGMDTAFFISEAKLAHASNYGESINILNDLPGEISISIKGGEQISTEQAYYKWDQSGMKSTADIRPILAAIKNKDSKAILANLHNDFQKIFPTSFSSQRMHVLSGSGGALAFFDVRST